MSRLGDPRAREHGVVLDLSTAQPHPSVTVARRDGVLHATTAAGPWSYAVLLPLPLPVPRPDGSLLSVVIELCVETGRLGVGVLNASETEFLTERQVPAARRFIAVQLTIADVGATGRLVFRNARLDGAASEFSVRWIGVEWLDRSWPVTVDARDVASEDLPPGGDARVFDDEEATRINRARIGMIESVGLSLSGARVLDAGCGVGRFAEFYLSKGCDVVAVDARDENIAELRRRNSNVRALVADVETFDLKTLGRFDIVHCLGLLYHLENPLAALRNLHAVCDGVLLLETMIVDSKVPMLVLADETRAVSQAMRGIGCRPSPSFVAMSLNRIGFGWVYGLLSDGGHEDFAFDWRDDGQYIRDGHPLRCFFVASHRPMRSRILIPLVAGWSPDGPLASAFALERYLVCGDARAAGRSSIEVETPDEPWAYALSFTADWPDGADRIDGLIQVTLQVAGGDVSLLALSRDGSQVIDEVFVKPSDAPVDATLVVAPAAACGQVVLRSGGGGRARADVRSLSCETVGEAERGDRLTAPANLTLKSVPGWSRYYGGPGITSEGTIDERLRSARYALLDRIKPMAWLEGLELLIRPNDELSRAVYVSGLYEPASLLTMKRLLPCGGVFLDIGANVGLYSLIASRWVGPDGRVFSFEPSEREYRHLRKHVELNHLANVATMQQAVVDREGRFDLLVAAFPHAGHNTLTGGFVYDGVGASHVEPVEGVTLDRFASLAQLDRIDLVKADVEGGELALLGGAANVLRQQRPSWIVEVASRGPEPKRQIESGTIRLFREARYRVFRLEDGDATLVEVKPGDVTPVGNLVAVPAERLIL
jgi:FkbM family methyltransferase